MIGSAVGLVHFMAKSLAQSGRIRRLIHSGSVFHDHVTVTQSIVVTPFPLKMTKRLRLAIVLAASAIVCGPVSAQALDKESYWYGFYVGAAATACGLNKAGGLSREYTQTFLVEAFQKDPDIPAASRDGALKEMRAKYAQCPLPQ